MTTSKTTKLATRLKEIGMREKNERDIARHGLQLVHHRNEMGVSRDELYAYVCDRLSQDPTAPWYGVSDEQHRRGYFDLTLDTMENLGLVTVSGEYLRTGRNFGKLFDEPVPR